MIFLFENVLCDFPPCIILQIKNYSRKYICKQNRPTENDENEKVNFYKQ